MTQTKKKNQVLHRKIKHLQHLMKTIAICNFYAESGGKTSAVFQGNNQVRTTPELSLALGTVRTHWAIMCGVLCRDQQGKHYIEFVEFETSKECLGDDLSEICHNICYQMFQEANKLHKLCPFYLAVPDKNAVFNFLQIYKTIHYHSVLDLIASNFEINVNKPIHDYTTKEWYYMPDIEFRYVELDLSQYYS